MAAEHDKPKKTIRIFVNNQPVEMQEHNPTGAEIKKAAGIPPTFKLYTAEGKEVPNDKKVNIKADEKFTAISGQDVS